jgi:fermentation-respiration switch protein FrsA (DUF1100 family)
MLGPLAFSTFFYQDRFKTEAAVKNLKCPLLVIHGDRDELIPIEHGQQVFEASRSERKFLFVMRDRAHMIINSEKNIAFPISDFMVKFQISFHAEHSQPDSEFNPTSLF